MPGRHTRRPRVCVADVQEQYVWTGKRWARQERALRRVVKWLAIGIASVLGGLLLAGLSIFVSFLLIWASTAVISYFL